MSEQVKRGRPGYDRRQILQVAVDVFNEQGYDATSVAQLAGRLGVSKAALYHHFTSKEELLAVALEEALGGLEAVWDGQDATEGTAATPATTASERLGAVLQAAVGVLAARLPYVRLLLRVRGNSDVERAALERRRAFDQRMTVLVRAAQAEGTVRADIDPAVATRLVFGMVNSLVEWYRPAGPAGVDTLAADVLAVVMDGLRTR